MISTRWRKVVRELWSNKTRSILVTASIAVGIFAVGTVQQLQTVIQGEMQAVYEASDAAQATLFTSGVDDDMIRTIERMPEISAVEGTSTVGVQVLLDQETTNSFTVVSIDDFEDIQVDKLTKVVELDGNSEFGASNSKWPGEDQVVIERSSVGSTDLLPEGLAVGDTMMFETASGRLRNLELSGVVYDPNGFSSAFTGAATGYVTPETFVRLGGSELYSQVKIRVAGTPEQVSDFDYISVVADSVKEKIEASGRTVAQVSVPDVGELPLQSLFDSLGLLLTPLGILALFLSGFLVINTISALMAQQVRQIGVMKAIGGQRLQIMFLYLGAVLIYSLIALAIAIPLTALVSGAIVGFLGGFINVTFPRFSLPFNVLLIEVAIGILVPLLAAVYPILKGTSITVREAISDTGGSTGESKTGWLSSIFARVNGISRPLQLSLRNTFRKRARLVITLITLVMGGMIFMTVGSVRSSLDNLINTGLAYYQFDIQIELERPYRQERLAQTAKTVPGVDIVESWGGGQGVPIREDGSEGDPLTITALDANSRMVEPTMAAGRWLMEDDQNAIVVSQNVLTNEPGLEIGDTLVLEIAGKESPWVVVGVAQVLGGPPNVVPAYVEYDYFSRLTESVGRASSLQFTMSQNNTMTQEEMAALMEEQLVASGINVAGTFTIDRLRSFTGSFFDIIIYLLLTMGVLIASVGALGLMGTMSTNVLERTREIGVMRAIGASDGAVLRIVVVEGVIIGMISWLVGAILAYPTGAALSTAVGRVLFSTSLPYAFSISGVITWFVIVALLAGVASFLPAWNASRLTVREVLSYE